MQSFKLWGAVIIAALLFNACTDDPEPTKPVSAQKGDFTLEFEHMFGDNPLVLGQAYTNGSGEQLNFTKVRYYVSNIQLEKMDGTVWSETESYHLVDASVSSSALISLNDVPAGEYHKISYQIGVDSVRNVSGAQEGALSPANDMFWTWNSGYIFFKIEGDAPAATDGKFVYHVGGFSGANNANIYKNHDLHNHMLSIAPNASPQVHLMVDVKKLFDGMHTVSVATMPRVHMPGQMAVHLSHNFGGGFTLDHIHD
jgi:hypothetical protein